jgi:hypothetical protein
VVLLFGDHDGQISEFGTILLVFASDILMTVFFRGSERKPATGES